MSADHEKPLLTTEERTFVERIAARYLPTPLTSTESAAFDRALEERIARRVRPYFFRPVILAATACAMALLWFTTAHYGLYSGDEEGQISTGMQAENADSEKNTSLLTYAYDNDELYDDEAEEEDDFLPDDYEALATVLVLSEG